MTKQDITYQDKFSELMLDISHPNNNGQVFILLEGNSDIRLFRKFFNLQNCKVERIPGGNSKVEECVADLIKIYSLVIGIRDADFIKLGTIPYLKPNMFLTDYHDMEMSLITEEETFSAIVFEYTDIEKSNHVNFRETIIKAINSVSYLKLLNQIENLEIKFEPTFIDLIDFAGLKIDFPQYFGRLLGKSPNAKITDLPTIVARMQALEATSPHPYQLCNGHDFIKALTIFIRQNGKAKSCNTESLASAFRMNFRNEYFVKTDLFVESKKWADTVNCAIY